MPKSATVFIDWNNDFPNQKWFYDCDVILQETQVANVSLLQITPRPDGSSELLHIFQCGLSDTE